MNKAKIANKSLQSDGLRIKRIAAQRSWRRLGHIKNAIVKMTNYAFLFINIH